MNKSLTVYISMFVVAMLFVFSSHVSAQVVKPHKILTPVKRVPPKLIHIHITKKINTKKPVYIPGAVNSSISKQKKTNR